ncbi:butyrophilin-like protein 3 [Chelmon rostratus]|uniref:butyrophilin-like protein 3 n=1 Tax=Chelmon rostratus TaxID=109905 RepID=UPI001BEADBBC|nr:butyrophilin-like protein 3 [Chelmon rostratus]
MSRKKFTHQELLVLHLWILILSATIIGHENELVLKDRTGEIPELVLKDRTCENPGAAPELLITIDDITKLGVRLKCDVRGAFPQPKLQWKHSDGSVLPAEEPQVSKRENRYDVTLWTTVSKTTTNRFQCVASQEGIRHVIHAEVAVSDELFEATHSRLPVIGLATGCIAFFAVLLAAICIKILCYKESRLVGDVGWKERQACLTDIKKIILMKKPYTRSL